MHFTAYIIYCAATNFDMSMGETVRYSDVTWASWRVKSPANPVVFNSLFRRTSKNYIKVPRYCITWNQWSSHLDGYDWLYPIISTLKPERNDHHFAYDISLFCIKYHPREICTFWWFNRQYKSALVQIMARYQTCDKQLFEPVTTQFCDEYMRHQNPVY